MRYETKFSAWIRSGGHSAFVVPLSRLRTPASKFTVAPDRLLDSIIDDALSAAVARLNSYLPNGVSVDITSVDLTPIRDEIRDAAANRLAEIGVAVDQNDPIITSIIARYAEVLNGFLQTNALRVSEYIWHSREDARVRPEHAQYDNHVFSWSNPPKDGPPGEARNCRCTAEPIIDLPHIPEAAVCDILTGDRLSSVFSAADADKLSAIARELDLRVVSGQIDTRERLVHFLSQMRQEAGSDAQLVENLNYKPSSLRATFRYFADHPDAADRYGRVEGDHPADQIAIANLAYANRNGNGDAATGDGWTYRGRGLFHLTGRGHYRDFTEWHETTFGGGIDFEAEPDLASEPMYAARSAIFFWLSNGLSELADAGLTDDATDAITARINLNTASYADRRNLMHDIRDGGQFDGICRFSVASPRFEDAK